MRRQWPLSFLQFTRNAPNNIFSQNETGSGRWASYTVLKVHLSLVVDRKLKINDFRDSTSWYFEHRSVDCSLHLSTKTLDSDQRGADAYFVTGAVSRLRTYSVTNCWQTDFEKSVSDKVQNLRKTIIWSFATL